MNNNNESIDDILCIGFDYCKNKDTPLLIVMRKNKNNSVEVINSFINQDAIDLYNKLIGKILII